MSTLNLWDWNNQIELTTKIVLLPIILRSCAWSSKESLPCALARMRDLVCAPVAEMSTTLPAELTTRFPSRPADQDGPLVSWSISWENIISSFHQLKRQPVNQDNKDNKGPVYCVDLSSLFLLPKTCALTRKLESIEHQEKWPEAMFIPCDLVFFWSGLFSRKLEALKGLDFFENTLSRAVHLWLQPKWDRSFDRQDDGH